MLFASKSCMHFRGVVMTKVNLLYPSDYFDRNQADPCYSDEYQETCKMPWFEMIRYDYDTFALGGNLKLYPEILPKGLCIYRGWMLKPDKYQTLYHKLYEQQIVLINSPLEYEKCHLFPNIYADIKDYTPKAIWYRQGEEIDWDRINREFSRFLIKDYVKSVKGTDFPRYFKTPVKKEEMKEYLDKFLQLRGPLFTGGIVIKEFVDLKRYQDKTNEYRIFYMYGEVITVSKNSEQSDTCPCVPLEFIEKFKGLKSNFYTVDFAELEDGNWIVIETGDGQVSGLAQNQSVFEFYHRLHTILSDIKLINKMQKKLST